MVAEVETIIRSIGDEKVQKEERDKTRDVFARIDHLGKELVSLLSLLTALFLTCHSDIRYFQTISDPCPGDPIFAF